MANERVVLITGATGQQGGAVARELVDKGFRLRGLTRKPEGPAAQALLKLGVEILNGDLDDDASVRRALEGVWGVYAVQTYLERGVAGEEEQGMRLVRAARAAGVQHYVYASVGSADRQTGIPHFENKWRIEETVRALGFPSHVILRPVFFMENLQSPWIRFGDRFVTPLPPTTRLQMIAVEDIGRYGARAFTHAAEMNGREVDIAGDEVTIPQAAELFSRATGRGIEAVTIPIEEVRKNSEDFALMYEWFEHVGYDVDIPALEREYGIRPTTLREWVERHVRS